MAENGSYFSCALKAAFALIAILKVPVALLAFALCLCSGLACAWKNEYENGAEGDTWRKRRGSAGVNVFKKQKVVIILIHVHSLWTQIALLNLEIQNNLTSTDSGLFKARGKIPFCLTEARYHFLLLSFLQNFSVKV